VLDALSVLAVVAGVFFFLSGTVGLLRFPEVVSRLHALTKADGLGLGLIVLGLALQATHAAVIGKLALVWIVAALWGSTACYLMAHHELGGREGASGRA
jgi:multicomponent Na+:H+ antiporter subunit G